MTRVALLHPCYWPEVRRGSERYIHDLAAGLMDRGHRPELITSHPAPATRTLIDELPVILNRRPPDGWLRRHRFDDYWTHVPWSYRSLGRGDYELAHAFYPTDALAAVRWARRAGKPSIFSVMGIPNPLIRIRLDSQPRAARASTAVTVDSRAVADAFFYRWGIEARVVYPGVDLESFGPSAPRHAAPVVFCPAQVEVARKRVNLLLDALPLLRERWPDAVLLLMKPSDEAAEAELHRAHEGLEFFDPVEDAGQLAELYARAWVTALPSYGEAFGMVLIESLACGTPVVAARRDAAPEIVASDDVGRLFDDSRPGTLTEALIEAIELARRPETATACRARAGVFSSARTVDAFESLYSELLG